MRASECADCRDRFDNVRRAFRERIGHLVARGDDRCGGERADVLEEWPVLASLIQNLIRRGCTVCNLIGMAAAIAHQVALDPKKV